MLAANHVKGIGNRKHVGAALEGCKPPIAHGPVTATREYGRHAATNAVFRRLIQARGVTSHAIARTAQVGALDTDVGSIAGAALRRRKMVEDAVKPSVHLVHGAIGNYVGLRNGNVPTVVLNVFCTAEGVELSEPRRAAARNKRNGLVITEAGKCRILGGEVVIKPNIELAFVDLPHRCVREVET